MQQSVKEFFGFSLDLLTFAANTQVTSETAQFVSLSMM